MELDHYCGRVLNERYSIVKPLARGGMGTVYLGKHLFIGRPLAIKILNEEYLGDHDIVARFYREAQAAVTIGHKNIIDILDVGVTAQGNPFLVMEYLEGESVRSLLKRRGPLSLETVCGILEPVLHALKAAHEVGIVHRDLKPDNIFLAYQSDGPPLVKLIDFGISKILSLTEQQTLLTRSGAVLGTPQYISPEQAQGLDDVNHRADIYAVGAILYEMLTGKHPFKSSNFHHLILQIVGGDARDPSALYAGFPVEAQPIIARAMSKSPDHRYQTAEEMLNELTELDAFKQRLDGLATLGEDGLEPGFAAGNLGRETATPGDDPRPIARDMFSQIAKEEISSAVEKTLIERERDTGTQADWSDTSEGKVASRSAVYLAAVIIIGVIGGIVALFALGPWGQSYDDSRRSIEMTRSGLDLVSIAVEGLPAGAKIYYDGELMKENPFITTKLSSTVPLRIEINGVETFRTTVVPEKNQIVRVKKPEKTKPSH